MKFDKILVRCRFLGVLVLATACSGGGEATTDPSDVLIFTDSGARQCESGGMSPDESAQALIVAGVDVLQSRCGIRTGVAYAAVCGGETGQIILHEIRAVNLPTARQLGYELASTLIDPVMGTSYQSVDCAN